jgi:putative aldouronate transport system substrate-binding protein
MKKLALIIVLMMVLSSADACSDQGGQQDSEVVDYTGGLPDGVVSTEPITLTAFQWALDNQTTPFDDLWFYNTLEEETNVHVDFTVVKDAEWQERTNTMLLSGDYPDLIIRPNQSLNIEEYGVTQKIFIPLDNYIEPNMPNYSSRINMNGLKDIMTSSDGNMYYIGYVSAQGVTHNANWFINQTWLDKVGMEIPTTVDELTEVLRAFRDQKPGTGSAVYPMSAGGGIYHQTNGIYNYFAMFGVPLQYFAYACIDDNGTVQFPGYMDGFRECLEWMNMLYNEDLLDKDSMTQSDDDKNAKVNADEVGFITYLRLQGTAWTEDTIKNWVSMLPPSAEGRKALVPRDIETELPAYGAVLTSANKYVPQTLRWLDAQLETERMMVAVNGPANENGPMNQGIKLNDQGQWEVIYTPVDNEHYNFVPVTQGQFFAPGDYIFDVYVMAPHRVERYDYTLEYEAAGVVEKNSYLTLTKLVKPTNEQATEQARRHDSIDQFMRERIATFIMNGVTDASWQAFLDEAANTGVDEYIATYQQLYDEYVASLN